jgi:hypothetical protein
VVIIANAETVANAALLQKPRKENAAIQAVPVVRTVSVVIPANVPLVELPSNKAVVHVAANSSSQFESIISKRN